MTCMAPSRLASRFRLYRLSTIFQFRNRNFLFRSGFNATYSTADRDCGATLTANANEQTLTYSHTAEPGNTQIYRCSWFISASSNTKMVDVKTTAMDMPGKTNLIFFHNFFQLLKRLRGWKLCRWLSWISRLWVTLRRRPASQILQRRWSWNPSRIFQSARHYANFASKRKEPKLKFHRYRKNINNRCLFIKDFSTKKRLALEITTPTLRESSVLDGRIIMTNTWTAEWL